MADSDCSNCEDFGCKFKHQDHYNCYVNKIKSVKTIFKKKDITKIESLLPLIDLLREEDSDYETEQTYNRLKEIVEMYKETL